MTDAVESFPVESDDGIWRGRYEAPHTQAGASDRARQSALAYLDGPMPPQTRGRRVALAGKRIIDLTLALLGLLVLAPVFVGLAAVVKFTSPGPVFFAQKRTGMLGQPFRMLKFRTMYVDQGDSTGVQQTKAGDNRVTPIGRFLRRTSLDELPQLINVVTGEMSLVGPRPHVEGMLAGGVDYAELVPYYRMRHLMRPGISGWAQVNGLRGPTDDAVRARARIDHDIAYLQNFSLWLDLRIIWLTVVREFITGSGV